MSDHYNLLGVTPEASRDEIRKAFRREAKHRHPDVLASRPAAEREAARVRFIQLAQAYQVLSDPQRRRAYDRERAAGGMPRGASGAAEGMAHAGVDHGRRTAPSGSRTQRRVRPERDAGPDGDTPGSAPRAPAGAGSGTSRTFARGTGSTARSTVQRGPSAFRATQGNPAQDLREVLKEAERSLSRFGLDLRHPVDAVLEELLDWARALYRDLAGAVAGSAPGTRPDPGAGAPRASPASRPRAEANSWAEPRPKASPSARQPQGPAASSPRAEGDKARLDPLSVERELEQIKRSMRNGSMRRAPTVDEELAELQRRHGKKP